MRWWKFRKNDKYTAIAFYSFLVVAALITAILLLQNLPVLFAHLHILRDVLWPLLIGFSFAYILAPLVRLAERIVLRRLKQRSRVVARVVALCLTYFVVLLVLSVFGLLIVPQILLNFQDFADNIVQYVETFVAQINAWLASLPFVEPGHIKLESFIKLDDLNSLAEWLRGMAGSLGSFGLGMLQTVGHTLLGIFLSAFFLFHKELIGATVKKLCLAVFPARVSNWLFDTALYADRAFGRFIVGKLFDSLVVGLIAFASFAIVGIPYYPLISAIVCLASIIPAVGPVIGMIPSFLIIVIKDPLMALWFLVIALIIQQLDGNIIGPKIVGSTTGVASVWVITAIMLAGAYFGPIGWFIGVPLFSVLYRVIGDFANRRLKKKGLPISLDYYTDAPLSSPIDTGARKQENEKRKEQTYEKVDE